MKIHLILVRIQFIIRFVVFSISVLLSLSSSASQQVTADRTSGTVVTHIRNLIAPQAKSELLSGVILIARGNHIIFQEAYGFASWELRVPNTFSTRFGIASITKSMTGTLVDLLVRAGRFDLNTPVEKYIPGFPKGPKGGVPTIGQLLLHSSGVPHRITTDKDETQVLHTTDIVERVKRAGLMFEPGSQRAYSSAGYTCLARVIEIIEKKPFESVLAERIFLPAGMASAMSETGQRLMPRRALSHRLGAENKKVVVKTTPYKDLRFLTGAGADYTTAEDLLHFVQAIHDGTFGAELWKQTFNGDATTWQSWTGRTNGFESSVDVLPAENLVFVFLSNLQSAANWQAREQIQRILAGQDPTVIPFPPPVAEQFEEPESLVGSYGSAEITLVDGKLFRGDNELYPIDGKKYYTPASGSILQFRRDSTGKTNALVTISGSGRETVLLRSAN